jgi:hypothetical protein
MALYSLVSPERGNKENSRGGRYVIVSKSMDWSVESGAVRTAQCKTLYL